jgi:predicted aspartyl protease
VAKIVGSVDDRSRQVVRLEVGEHSLLLLVDTGFNGDLLFSASAARALGMAGLGRARTIELGDGTTAELRQQRARIPWLGAARDVRALIADYWQPLGDDPVGLVGTELITPHLLLIDFAARAVEIETQ